MKWPFDFFSRKGGNAKNLAAAPAGQPTGSMPGAADFFARGYEAVKGPFDEMRREAVIETRGEDKQLPAGKRLKITNLQRDMLRNSPMRISQDQQLRVNIVGPEGGKLYASFPPAYKDASDEVIHYEIYGDYDPMEIFNSDPEIRQILTQLINGTFDEDTELFRPLYNSLLNTQSTSRADTYFILKDFRSYAEAQKKVEQAYRELIRRDPERFIVVDASQPPEVMGEEIAQKVIQRLVEDELHASSDC